MFELQPSYFSHYKVTHIVSWLLALMLMLSLL
uniref:Uncharacterized protein n=1 Tax=Anguilla anguilla TaxID=7936 RepID=A0A0E9SVJ7_ANGAN